MLDILQNIDMNIPSSFFWQNECHCFPVFWLEYNVMAFHAPIFFAFQYDAVGWTPKEYNPDDKQSTSGQEQIGGEIAVQHDGSAPQSGFVWDEASGYYFDAASGFYYDGNTGLYIF